MKFTYKIYNKKGVFLCYQVAKSESEAVYSAKNYYGHKGAVSAELL